MLARAIYSDARLDFLRSHPELLTCAQRDCGPDPLSYLFLAGEPFPGRLAGHTECFAYARPAGSSRSQFGDVMSDGALHVLVSSVGPYHLGEQLVV